MIVLPAIDMKDGRCVRLRKGDFDTVHQVAAGALETARRFADAGAKWVHMVDLDGARDGVRKNFPQIFEVITQSGLQVELGGGIKSVPDLITVVEAGAARAVVGSAAVEARIVSPAVLIVVAIAGIAGYTMPSQDLAGALRLWRFLLALCASVGGLFGIAAGAAALVFHLAGIESFGVAYLTPFAANAGEQVEGDVVLRQPLPQDKQRPAYLNTGNRRKQK